jgi:hypothetical protein
MISLVNFDTLTKICWCFIFQDLVFIIFFQFFSSIFSFSFLWTYNCFIFNDIESLLLLLFLKYTYNAWVSFFYTAKKINPARGLSGLE